MYLVVTAQTQVEFYENSKLRKRAKRNGTVFVNIYDLGKKKNFEAFFGHTIDRWWMLLFPSFKLSRGDGINYVAQ